jgi:basic membrane protein A
MKRIYITTFLTCAAVLVLFFGISRTRNISGAMSSVTVGFIYEGDETAPYTYNFARAQVMLHEELRDSVNILARNNVPDDAIEDTLRELSLKGCSIIFTNSHSEAFAELAPSYPEVQICQISDMAAPAENHADNYHTFNGEIYQARYISGVAAGLKLQEMVDNGLISRDEALVGYVGAFPVPTVISGYTAFLIGVRSVFPTAVMKVRYTNTWASYRDEKACAEELIREGCVVLSHHSDTIGPAVACEEASARQPAVFVGCNESYLDIAPSSALLSIRINWTPYVIGAVQAVMNHQRIESFIRGNRHSKNDISAGLEQDNTLEFLDLNLNLAAKGTQMVMDNTAAILKKEPTVAFQGPYTGKDPSNPSDTISLDGGYLENMNSSMPSFHYILNDVIEVES